MKLVQFATVGLLLLTAQVRAADPAFCGADVDSFASLTGLAQSMLPDLAHLPTFDANPLYTMIDKANLVPIVVDGETQLGIIGGGLFGSRDYPGYLVAIWRKASQSLEPIGGFQIEEQCGKVVSVSQR
jgi:hypothetical protein